MTEELTGCGRNPCFVLRVSDRQLAPQAFCNCSREKLIEKILELEEKATRLQSQMERVVKFPAVLRKMWSGAEVATWIDDAIDDTHEEKSDD